VPLDLTLVGEEAEGEGEQYDDRTECRGDPREVRDLTDDRPTPRVEQETAERLAPEQRLDLARERGVVRVGLGLRAHL